MALDPLTVKRANMHLRKVDPVMAGFAKRLVLDSDYMAEPKKAPHFHSLVQTIINQQLSLKAAATISRRVLVKQGGRYFSAKKIVAMPEESLRACGLSKNKVRYVLSLAHAVISGDLNFRKLVHKDDASIREILTQLPGIGVWSADIFLMFPLGRLDVFPVGDLIIRKTICRHYNLRDNASIEEYQQIAQRWSPYRSIASHYLWAAAE